MKNISVFYEHTDFIIVNKPAGLPSAPLSKADEPSALSQIISIYPEIGAVKGRKAIECGLVHRIDTDTYGLLLFARSDESYEYFFDIQKKDLFLKEYTAVCSDLSAQTPLLEGFPPTCIEKKNDNSFTVSSLFRPFGPHRTQVRPVRLDEKAGSAAAKKAGTEVYTTEVVSISMLRKNTDGRGNSCRAVCRITRGFRHQVRCHLSWTGYPVIGDKLYHPDYINSDASNSSAVDMIFCASGLQFPDRSSSRMLHFTIEKPFSAE